MSHENALQWQELTRVHGAKMVNVAEYQKAKRNLWEISLETLVEA